MGASYIAIDLESEFKNTSSLLLGVSCQKMRYLAELWLLQIIKGIHSIYIHVGYKI
jgi:hypothetical protein